jgi:YebC/PmpR family DNA-binding regulatory protein
MAGHSKWANIQYRKGTQDARRARLFTRLIREIHTAVRHGGADPQANPRLRLALERANEADVPKDTIERAIRRAQGPGDGESLEEVRYEGYGPGGVAVLVECLTDNRNRTAGEVRHAFSKHGGNLGANGAVSYLFHRVGLLAYPSDAPEERLFEVALEAGAEDVQREDDGTLVVQTDPEEFETVRRTLLEAGLPPERGEVTLRASTQAAVTGETAEQVLRLLNALEDIDDTQNVYSNVEFPAGFTPGGS